MGYRGGWHGAALMVALAAAGCTQTKTTPEAGRALYDNYCVTCHGPAGKGDGPLAADWPVRPADLTQISANNGGVFPLTRVMSQIDGYTRSGSKGSAMPEMGQVFQDSPKVMVDLDDGTVSPVPSALLDLARYIETLQD